jgi:hypothetical protein
MKTRPEELQHIEATIKAAEQILTLPTNWDDEGSWTISPVVFQQAVDFIWQYALHLYTNGEYQFVLAAPQITPGPNNTLDVSWTVRANHFLINIGQTTAEYYGTTYYKKEIQGHLTLGVFDEKIALWLLNVLVDPVTVEDYLDLVKKRNRETFADGHIVEFHYSDEEIDKNKAYFRKCWLAELSPYKALTFFELDAEE